MSHVTHCLVSIFEMSPNQAKETMYMAHDTGDAEAMRHFY